MKEEATKFIVSLYHNDFFWLLEPVAMTTDILAYNIGLPTRGDPVPVSSKGLTLLEELIESPPIKNSKVIMINHITNMEVKWTIIIVSIFLTNYSWPFNIKK